MLTIEDQEIIRRIVREENAAAKQGELTPEQVAKLREIMAEAHGHVSDG